MNPTAPENESIAKLAQALADPLRITVLLRLLGGPATVAELISLTGESQSKVSNHLALMRERGLVRGEKRGRQVVYEIADPAIAELVESLLVAGGVPNASPYRESGPLARARTCYDHLAGRLGVGVFDALVSAEALLPATEERGNVELGPNAEETFRRLGVDLSSAERPRRRFAYACPDWIERRPHLGGALGAALYARFSHVGWVRARPQTREVVLTHRGKRALESILGLKIDEASVGTEPVGSPD